MGNVGGPDVLVHGVRIPLPEADVTMENDSLEVRDGRLAAPARFVVSSGPSASMRTWRLVVRDAGGRPVRVIAGEGAPPADIVWDGLTDGGSMVEAGERYDYQLESAGPEGILIASPRRVFGVAKASRVILAMTARGLGEGSAVLGPDSIRVLREAGRVMRKYPGGTIAVEGHTDSAGAEGRNLALSIRRAEAAASFLAGEEGIPRDRIAVRGYGGGRPVAGNGTPHGRWLNRRVEIRGEFLETRGTAVLDRHRAAPTVRVNGIPLETDADGRFAVRLPGTPERIDLDMVSPRGMAVRASIPVPRVELGIPENAVLTSVAPGAVPWRLSGRTEPGNEVVFCGKTLKAGADGSFSVDVDLTPGRNALGLVVRNAAGCACIVQANILASPAPFEGRPR